MSYCQFCNNNYDMNDLTQHNKICIYYIYNTTYNKQISKQDIHFICDILNMFNLVKYSINSIFNVNDIIKTLIIKFQITENPIIITFISYFQTINNKSYSYDDILFIIETITHYSKNDIINILNAYKICYHNLN